MRYLSYGKDQTQISINALTKEDIANDILKKNNLDSLNTWGKIPVLEDKIEDINSKWNLAIIDFSHDQIVEKIQLT